MAVIDWTDYSEMRNYLYRLGQGKEEMKALANLPSIDQLKAVFQAVEDWYESEQTSLKSVIDTAYGQTTSVSLARKIMKWWITWKIGRL